MCFSIKNNPFLQFEGNYEKMMNQSTELRSQDPLPQENTKAAIVTFHGRGAGGMPLSSASPSPLSDSCPCRAWAMAYTAAWTLKLGGEVFLSQTCRARVARVPFSSHRLCSLTQCWSKYGHSNNTNHTSWIKIPQGLKTSEKILESQNLTHVNRKR